MKVHGSITEASETSSLLEGVEPHLLGAIVDQDAPNTPYEEQEDVEQTPHEEQEDAEQISNEPFDSNSDERGLSVRLPASVAFLSVSKEMMVRRPSVSDSMQVQRARACIP
jgi:hypothetical protein